MTAPPAVTPAVTPQTVDRLLRDLEGLRGCVSGRGPRQADRIDGVLARARALHAAALGTAHEPALRGCTNQLSRLLAAVHGPDRPDRIAG